MNWKPFGNRMKVRFLGRKQEERKSGIIIPLKEAYGPHSVGPVIVEVLEKGTKNSPQSMDNINVGDFLYVQRGALIDMFDEQEFLLNALDASLKIGEQIEPLRNRVLVLLKKENDKTYKNTGLVLPGGPEEKYFAQAVSKEIPDIMVGDRIYLKPEYLVPVKIKEVENAFLIEVEHILSIEREQAKSD